MFTALIAYLTPPSRLAGRLSTQSLLFALGEGTFMAGSAVFFTEVVGLTGPQVGLGLIFVLHGAFLVRCGLSGGSLCIAAMIFDARFRSPNAIAMAYESTGLPSVGGLNRRPHEIISRSTRLPSSVPKTFLKSL